MSLRFHEIAEQNHHILNPFTHEKLMLLGEICQLDSTSEVLDLCCGKGEMLSQWSKHWGISGRGVDISSVFLDAAKRRAEELSVAEKITFIREDAAKYEIQVHAYDVVSCIGATWIGDGLVGTIKLLEKGLKSDGLMLIGEPFLIGNPPNKMYDVMGMTPDTYTSLLGTYERIESASFELVEMVVANQDSWDRYVAQQWMTIDTWLRANSNHELVDDLGAWNARWKRIYLELQRDHFGWAAFVIRRK